MNYKHSGVKYWTKRFDHLKPLDIINQEKLIDMYASSYRDIKFSENVRCTETTLAKTFYSSQDLKYGELDTYYVSQKSGNLYDDCYTLDRVFPKHRHGFEINITNDLERGIGDKNLVDLDDSESKYLYLEIPYQFIYDYMHTIFPIFELNRNFYIVKEFLNDVEKSRKSWKPSNFIPIINKYDKVNPNPHYYKDKQYSLWRWKFSIPWHVSVKEFGLLYPPVTRMGRDDIILFDGPHRIFSLPYIKSDIPTFVKFNENNLKDNKLILFSPPFFTSLKVKTNFCQAIKNSCVFEIDFSKKKIKIYMFNNTFLKNIKFKKMFNTMNSCFSKEYKHFILDNFHNENIEYIGQCEYR